jgi:hypothetical protein
MTTERTNLVSIAAGLCFMALGVLLLLERNGVIELRQIVQVWPAGLILIGGAVILQARRGGEVGRGVHVGGLVWLLILGMLFSYTYDRRSRTPQQVPGGSVDVFAVMSGDPTIFTGTLTGGRITTVMGGAELDLRGASLAPGQTAVIDLFSVMGGSVIRVPGDWRVDVEATAIMGGIKDERRARPRGDAAAALATPTPGAASGESAGGAGAVVGETAAAEPGMDPAAAQAAPAAPPHLVLKGTVFMGGVNIKS